MLWILDIEAFQIRDRFYPLEICLLNTEKETCNLFFVKYRKTFESRSIRLQFGRHGIDWHDGDISIFSAIKAIKKRIKADDKICVKGEQKLKYLQKLFDFTNEQIFEIKNAPTLSELVESNDESCYLHFQMHKTWWCARRRCFAILKYLKRLEHDTAQW